MSEVVFRGRRVSRDRPLIMAIVNRTPDSFYDGGTTFAEDSAQRAIRSAIEEGADIIDIGGVSARPGPAVPVEEEIRRVLPTVEWTRAAFPDIAISVDTWRPEVADLCCRAGADLINDNWAASDPAILDVAAEHGAGYVCCHTGGLVPRTYPTRIHYDDVVAEVLADAVALAEKAVARGVPREGIVLDPALDFSKNTFHSLALLREVPELTRAGWPILMAISHKSFVSETLDTGPRDRLVGTLAATAISAYLGAAIFRVHEVRETRQTLEMAASIQGGRTPARPRIDAPTPR